MSSASERMMKLMAYADGELGASERLEVERWLLSDGRAAETVNAFAELGDVVQLGYRGSATATSVASFDIADTLMAVVEKESAPAAHTAPVPSNVVPFRSRRAGVIAAAALALAASVFLMTRAKDEQPIARGPSAQPAPATVSSGGVDVDLHETPESSVSVFYLPSETNLTTSVVVWVDETGAK